VVAEKITRIRADAAGPPRTAAQARSPDARNRVGDAVFSGSASTWSTRQGGVVAAPFPARPVSGCSPRLPSSVAVAPASLAGGGGLRRRSTGAASRRVAGGRWCGCDHGAGVRCEHRGAGESAVGCRVNRRRVGGGGRIH